MHQMNDINDAVNDVVMVDLNGQNRRLFLYNIGARYIYLQFLLGVQ